AAGPHPGGAGALPASICGDGRHAARRPAAARDRRGGRAALHPHCRGAAEPRRREERRRPLSPRAATPPPELRIVRGERLVLPTRRREVVVRAGKRTVRLTNLSKLFFPEAGITKRELLQYYIDVAPLLLPHLRRRAMVMK